MATSTIKDNRVHRINVESSSVTIAADARSYVDIATGLSSGTTIISLELYQLPNWNWVTTNVMLLSESTLRCYYHNEYSGSLTGKFGFRIAYTVN